jgi:hypothetical protein
LNKLKILKNLNACNKALIKTTKAKLEQMRPDLFKHLLIILLLTELLFLICYQKCFISKLGFILDSSL